MVASKPENPGVRALLDLGSSIAAGGAAPEYVTVSWDVFHEAALLLWPVRDEHGREDYSERELRIKRDGEVSHRISVRLGCGMAPATLEIAWLVSEDENGQQVLQLRP